MEKQKICKFCGRSKHDDWACKSYVDHVIDDGLPLFSAVHKPWPYPFHIRIWNWIKAIFVRPKFSKEAIEPYVPTKEEKEYHARVLGDFEALGISTGPKKGERIKPCTCMSCRAYMTSIGKPDYWKEIK